MAETIRESDDLSLIKGNMNISLDNTEKVLNNQEDVKDLLKLDAEDEKIIKKLIDNMDDSDIRWLDVAQLTKEMKWKWFTANEIAEIEKYATTIKTNPNKLKDDFDNQFIPPRRIIPIIGWILGLSGCSEKAETPDKRMEKLFKDLNKKNLEYKWSINVIWGSYRFNSIKAQKVWDDMEIYVKWTLMDMPPEIEHYCLVYNEKKKVFTYRELNILWNVDYEQEISGDKVEYTLMDVESRRDAIKNAIDKNDVDDSDVGYIKRKIRQKWKKLTRAFR